MTNAHFQPLASTGNRTLKLTHTQNTIFLITNNTIMNSRIQQLSNVQIHAWGEEMYDYDKYSNETTMGGIVLFFSS